MPAYPARTEVRRRRVAAWLLALAALLGGAAQAPAADAVALRERAATQMREGGGPPLQRTLEALLALERSPRALNDLGLLLSDQGDFDAAQGLLAEAVAASPADQRGVHQANLALNLRRQFRDGEAEALLLATLEQIDRYDGPRNGWRPCNLARSRAVALIQLSRIAERRGALAQALAHAQSAQVASAQALELLPPQATPAERQWAAADHANALRREVHVHIQAQRGPAAEQALVRWRAAADAHRLGSVVQAQMHAAEAMLAMSRLDYDDAARSAGQADARYAEASYAPGHLARLATLETRLAAIWAARRSAAGLALLQAFDGAVPASASPGAATQLALARGLIYLDAGRVADAATLFEAQQQLLRAIGGEQGLAHAEAVGLQGVALWAGDAAERARARPLLAQAAEQLVTPIHASAPDGSGLRALIRRRVVEAHVASQLDSSTAPPPSVAALLDWVAEGAVQRAVTQAAARLEIADPALRELVRREQDLRRAIEAHARALGGSAGPGDDEARTSRTAAAAAAGQSRLAGLRAEWQALAATLLERDPDYAALTQPLPPSIDRITAALRGGEALLIITSRDDDTLVWLLRQNGRNHSLRVALPLARTQALVGALRASLEFPERGRLPAFDRRSAGELHRLLIEPLREGLDGVSHLAVITSGPLAAMPLAVLAPDDGRPARDAGWLIRGAAISQTTSLSAWLAARRTAAAEDRPLTMLGWGDPDFGRGAAPAAGQRDVRAVAVSSLPARALPDPATAFASLPDTRDELIAIARALGADPERSLYLGPRATRQSILDASRSGRLAQARVIAFATHGLKAGQWPGLDQPALVMSMPQQGPVPDATAHMLSLDDAMSLKLDAQWLVLSACNTTAGDHEAGEALSGLARGMFYAGARSLLATHWAVDSRSAAALVSATFRAYAGPARPGKAQALRDAMLQLLAQPATSHPAYWAPYVVIGDG
jgi:CHAT domain-containing protein